MTDLAEFGVIVHGGEARRELKMTREEFIALANGGKLAEDAMKKVFPPTVVPPNVPSQINAVTQAIVRMRQAAAQSTANAFGAQLAIQMDLAEKSAMRLQRGLDGVIAAQRRMQQAAAQSRAASMAAQISAADPFQSAGGFDGAQLGPAVPAHLLRTAQAAQGATMSVDRLRGALTQIAISAAGIPGPLGRLASTLGQFAIGGALTVGIIAGIALIGIAYEKLTEKSRKAREEWERQLDVLQRLRREQELGPLGETGAAVRGGRGQLAVLGAEINEIAGAVLRGEFIGPIKAARLREITALYTEIALAVQAGEREVTRIEATEEDKRKRARQDAANERIAQVRREKELEARARAEQDATVDWYVKQFVGLDDQRRAAASDRRTLIGQDKFGFQLDPMIDFGKSIQDLIKRFKELQEAADALAKKQKEAAIADVASNIGGHIDRALGTGGLVGGLGAAWAAGNPYAAAATGINFVVDALFSLGEESSQVRQQLRALANETEGYSDQLEVMLGVMSSVEARQRALTREYAAAREDLERGIEAARNAGNAGADIAKDFAAQLKALNALEVIRLQLLREETLQMNITMGEDLRVRLLRAQGRDEEADALQQALAHQREYAEAMQNGADIVNLFRLREVQRLEAVDLAMTQVQRRIDSLTATISGLQEFRNSLLVSATQSPTARLAEATRQYDEILAAARAADVVKAQAAAGRLPGAAETLLEASRAVNASGAGFQSDFARVLADSQSLIERFQNVRSLEEQQLEELKRIRENTGGWEEVLRPVGTLPAGSALRSGDGGSGDLAVQVLQQGFTDVLASLAATNARLDTLDRTLDRGLDSISANVLS